MADGTRGTDGVRRLSIDPGGIGMTGGRKPPLDRADLEFIRTRRAKGVAWFSIGKMLGRNANDLRDRFEQADAP